MDRNTDVGIENDALRQAAHLSHYKQFGTAPSVTVSVRDKRDHISSENRVLINWSCVGNVSLIEAEEFRDDLAMAIRYAKIQRKQLHLSHGEISTTASRETQN